MKIIQKCASRWLWWMACCKSNSRFSSELGSEEKEKGGSSKSTMKIRYFHGSGGGGVVTKGALNLTRALEKYEDFDVFTMGHIHENAARNDVRDKLYYRGRHKL